MKTDELIVQLAREASPVRQLPRPARRLMVWIAGAVPFTVIAVLVLRPRRDLLAALQEPEFTARAGITLAAALLAAASAFVLSVPGAERSPLQRAVPFLACGLWMLVLAGSLLSGGNAAARLAALPVHLGCVLQIIALSAVPVVTLFVMLRRAAPLRPGWNATLAALAATALAAAGTQILCPIDDAAHHLVGHALPSLVLTAGVGAAGRSRLHWTAHLSDLRRRLSVNA